MRDEEAIRVYEHLIFLSSKCLEYDLDVRNMIWMSGSTKIQWFELSVNPDNVELSRLYRLKDFFLK